MAIRLSRRKLARYYAQSLIDSVDTKKLAPQLAAYLVESGRTKELQLIIDDINYQLSLIGVVTATVTSAHNLDTATQKSIIDLISKKTNATDVQLQKNINPSVFGGLKLEFPGFEMDTTIARRLTTLKTNYKK